MAGTIVIWTWVYSGWTGKDAVVAPYRDDQGCDSAGEACEHPAQVEHPHVLRRDDDGEAKDEGQRAEHQAELPADPLHHPAAQQAAQRRSHRHYGLSNKQHAASGGDFERFDQF